MSAGYTFISRLSTKELRRLFVSVGMTVTLGAALVSLGLLYVAGSAQVVLLIIGGVMIAVPSVALTVMSIGSEATSFAAMAARQAARTALSTGVSTTSLLDYVAGTLGAIYGLSSEKEPQVQGPPAPPPPPLSTSDRAALYEESARERLLQHSGLLGSRANFALGWGLFFAATGVVILGWALITAQQPIHEDLVGYIAHYLPRLSITIIVELVAFFFLKTYARTLTDIRYIQNEMTNVEMKLIGLHRSVELNLTDASKKAIVALVNTERNHILEKGQTSLEMERERVEQEGFNAGARALADAFNGRLSPEKSSE